MLNLECYFKRIGYIGTPRPDLLTLTELQTRHLRSIPFENLDIHLGISTSFDPNEILQKIAIQGRGGWCYETNVLFFAVLRELGFESTFVGISSIQMISLLRAAGRNEFSVRHPAIRVDLGQPYLSDVGTASGSPKPIPLNGDDEAIAPITFEEMRATSNWFRTDELSPHLRNVICQWTTEDGVFILHNREFIVNGRRKIIDTLGEYDSILRDTFGIRGVKVDALWKLACSRDGKRITVPND